VSHSPLSRDLRRLGLPLALLLFGGGLVATGWPPGNEALGNVLLGAGIALSATYLTEKWKRDQLGSDLAETLYHELANRVARLCFDYEAPWSLYEVRPRPLGRFSVGKFVPEIPTIFMANADKLALFGSLAPTALMSFYFRMTVLRRDIENLREDARDHSDLGPDQLRIIASRYAAAIVPAINALDALAPFVANAARIEAAAMDTFDPGPDRRRPGSLRERLSAMREYVERARA